MPAAVNEELLRRIAATGEIDGHDLISLIPRTRGDLTDFYSLAAMIQTDYVAATTVPGTPFGRTVRETAALLHQLSLKPGESFQYDEVTWEAWATGPVTFFITGPGVLKLEELDGKASAKRQKRKDYWVSVLVAVLAAALSTTATHFYSVYRESLAKPPLHAPKPPPSPNNSFKPKPLRGSA